jgi:hypothetical protein
VATLRRDGARAHRRGETTCDWLDHPRRRRRTPRMAERRTRRPRARRFACRSFAP